MKKHGLIAEFKEFVMRGNVVDMAVGVIVGASFGNITTSLVNDIFMPLIGWLIGDMDLTALNITLRQAVMDGETVVSEAVVVGIGTFLATVIDFLLVALVIFLFVKGVNRLRRRPKEEPAPPAPPEPTTQELLLAEIRALLQQQKHSD